MLPQVLHCFGVCQQVPLLRVSQPLSVLRVGKLDVEEGSDNIPNEIVNQVDKLIKTEKDARVVTCASDDAEIDTRIGRVD